MFKQSDTETLQPRSSQHRIQQNYGGALHLNKVDEYVIKNTHFSVISVFGHMIIMFVFSFCPNVGYYLYI